jgi:hypothetical protein
MYNEVVQMKVFERYENLEVKMYRESKRQGIEGAKIMGNIQGEMADELLA